MQEKLVSTKTEWIDLLNGDDTFDEGAACLLDPEIEQTVKYQDGNEIAVIIHFPDGDWIGTFLD